MYYLRSITNVNDPHLQHNGVESLPLLRFFPVYEQQLNWVYVSPWSPETAGPLCPSLELIICGHALHSSILELGSLYSTYFAFI